MVPAVGGIAAEVEGMTGESQGRLRLFVAVDLPAGAKAALAASIGQLGELLPAGVRWVNPAGIHLTLKFLGEVDRGLVEPLGAALQEAAAGMDKAPFPLHLEGLGVFPNRREPRVIWAGVGGDLDTLGRLQGLVETAAASLGFAEERREFRAHLTLGRVRDGVRPAARREIGSVVVEQAGALEPKHCWEVGEISLIRSVLTPQGAVYSTLGTARLGSRR